MIFNLSGKTPEIGENVFIAQTAILIGDVTVGDHSSIWYGTVVRGDVHSISIGRKTNIQDNSTLHVTNDAFPLKVGDEVTVGHNAVLHGCTIENRCLIGIGSIVLDGAKIGEGSILAAGTVVTPGTKIPPHSLVVGSPGKVTKDLGEGSSEAITLYSKSYLEIVSMYPRG